MLSREEVVSAVSTLETYLFRNGKTSLVGDVECSAADISGSSIRIERTYRDGKSPGSLDIYEDNNRIAWIALEDTGRILGWGGNPEVLIKVSGMVG